MKSNEKIRTIYKIHSPKNITKNLLQCLSPNCYNCLGKKQLGGQVGDMYQLGDT